MTSTRPTRVAAVVAAAVAMILAAGCGIPTSDSPQAISKHDVPFDLLNPTTPTTVPTTVPAGVPEVIYLVATTQTVIPVTRNVEVPANLTQVLGVLLEGPTSYETAFGIQSYLTGTTDQVSATVQGGIATVDFTSNPLIQVVGPNQTVAIAQVVYTATEQAGVTGVDFEIGGVPTDVPIANGSQVSGPVDRSDYLAQAPTTATPLP
jgi:spore germination protein GerM